MVHFCQTKNRSLPLQHKEQVSGEILCLSKKMASQFKANKSAASGNTAQENMPGKAIRQTDKANRKTERADPSSKLKLKTRNGKDSTKTRRARKEEDWRYRIVMMQRAHGMDFTCKEGLQEKKRWCDMW